MARDAVRSGTIRMALTAIQVEEVAGAAARELSEDEVLKVLGREGWRTSVITSVAIVVAFYLLFVALLSVPIPHMF